MSNFPDSIVIIGDGTEAWITAAFFSKLYGHTNTSITLIARKNFSREMGISSVHPGFKSYLDFLDIDERSFMKRTNSAFKMAQLYSGWHSSKHLFFHAFDTYGVNKGASQFHQTYSLLSTKINLEPFDHYSFGVAAAKADKFCHPDDNQNSITSSIKYAWHFNTCQFTDLLMEYCRSNKVNIVYGDATLITNSTDEELVDHVYVADENQTIKITADLYIACAPGIHSTENDLNKIDWRSEICTNCSISTFQTGQMRNILCDVTTSLKNGYENIKPDRNGIEATFYSNDSLLSEELLDLFLKRHNYPDFEKKVCSPFRTKHFWQNNFISLGPSCTALPTHSISGIDLLWQALKIFIKYTPERQTNLPVCMEFNRLLGQRYDNIKDFIVMQFLLNKNTDDDFWKFSREAKISSQLQHKISLFESRGNLPKYEGEFFSEASQISFLIGMGKLPRNTNPIIFSMSPNDLMHHITQVKSKIIDGLSTMPSHREYLTSYVGT